MKKIAVQEGLNEIESGLIDLGYDVKILGKYFGYVDAVVYTRSNSEMLNTLVPSNNGILMINAKNKTVKEIDLIITRKVYSPLF